MSDDGAQITYHITVDDLDEMHHLGDTLSLGIGIIQEQVPGCEVSGDLWVRDGALVVTLTPIPPTSDAAAAAHETHVNARRRQEPDR